MELVGFRISLRLESFEIFGFFILEFFLVYCGEEGGEVLDFRFVVEGEG